MAIAVFFFASRAQFTGPNRRSLPLGVVALLCDLLGGGGHDADRFLLWRTDKSTLYVGSDRILRSL